MLSHGPRIVKYLKTYSSECLGEFLMSYFRCFKTFYSSRFESILGGIDEKHLDVDACAALCRTATRDQIWKHTALSIEHRDRLTQMQFLVWIFNVNHWLYPRGSMTLIESDGELCNADTRIDPDFLSALLKDGVADIIRANKIIEFNSSFHFYIECRIGRIQTLFINSAQVKKTAYRNISNDLVKSIKNALDNECSSRKIEDGVKRIDEELTRLDSIVYDNIGFARFIELLNQSGLTKEEWEYICQTQE